MTAPDATAGDGLEWLYNEASGVLYGPDPEHPRLRYPVAAEVPPLYGHRLAADMNASAPDATAGDGLRQTAEDGRLHDQMVDVLRRAHVDHAKDVADVLLTEVPALRDVLAAAARDAEKVRRVEKLAADMATAGPGQVAPVRGVVLLITQALDPS